MPEKRSIPLSVPNLSMDIVENIKDTIESGWVSTGGKSVSYTHLRAHETGRNK